MNRRKNRVQKDIVLITISMFAIAVLWIVFNLYNAYVTSTIDEALQITIQPIVGKFDTDTIRKLRQRPAVIPNYETPIATLSAPKPPLTPEPTSAASQSATIPVFSPAPTLPEAVEPQPEEEVSP